MQYGRLVYKPQRGGGGNTKQVYGNEDVPFINVTFLGKKGIMGKQFHSSGEAHEIMGILLETRRNLESSYELETMERI